MSFDHVMIPTCGNWFQTNPPEDELDDHAGNTVSSVCVTNGKDMDYCGFVKPKLVLARVF